MENLRLSNRFFNLHKVRTTWAVEYDFGQPLGLILPGKWSLSTTVKGNDNSPVGHHI
jgi:hypothetical protein